MATINDEVVRATGGSTFNEGLAIWFTRTAAESLQDAESRWLFSQVAVTVLGPINDMWFTFLRAGGFTGTLTDMKHQYWSAQI